MCFRAIIEYLYKQREISLTKPKEKNEMINEGKKGDKSKSASESSQTIIQTINSNNYVRGEVVDAYTKLMANYFRRIDAPAKIKMTVEYLFEKNDIDIICLQEANDDIKSKLDKQ
jgi:hypothetical protein